MWKKRHAAWERIYACYGLIQLCKKFFRLDARGDKGRSNKTRKRCEKDDNGGWKELINFVKYKKEKVFVISFKEACY